MTNEEYWTKHHDRGPKTTGVTNPPADPELIATMDKAIRAEWIETINQAVDVYHTTERSQVRANVVEQMAEYYTEHQFDFTRTESAEGVEDEVSEMDVADLYHFLVWQAHKFDIWMK